MHEHRTRRRIEFADTDAGGIVHFARFFVFMETAEHELLSAIGTSVHTRLDGRLVGWPRLSATCEYLSPARFGDDLEIHLEVERKGTKSMSYRFTFRRGETLIARGRTAAVCCLLDDPSGLKSIPIPGVVADNLEEAPREA
jgi:YbgC/YbaW family acyl-CoA thioester hydrolase